MKRDLCIWLVLAYTGASGTAAERVQYRVEAVAGSASLGDGGPAASAQIGSVQGIAVDRAGNLYIADTDHHRVRRVAANGTITTVAGTGVAGFSGDGGPATSAQFNLPYGIAADSAGFVYVADLGNSRVRRIAPDGTITTVAGGGKASPADGSPATQAQLLGPRNVAVDALGALYISEFEGHRIRRVTPDGRISTFAGTGVAGFRGDGGPATVAQFGYPAGLAFDWQGALYVADSQNHRVRKVLSGGIVTTVLGGTSDTALQTPVGVAVDPLGAIYVVDSSFVVRAYRAGAWVAFAGKGPQGFDGDGGPAAQAELMRPRDLATDISGGLYIADGVRVRLVDAFGQIRTVAGDGYLHAIGDSGPPAQALLVQPLSVALDAAGSLYIADPGNQRVRQVQPSGTMTTLAGVGTAGTSADGAAAFGAALNTPMGVAVDSSGNVLIADSYNHRIRRVGPDRRITTIAGTGHSGMGPELLPPLETQLSAPRGVCLDRSGSLYIVDTANHRVLRVRNSLVETAAGNGAPGDKGDGGPARIAQLNQPSACALDSAGNLFIADTLSHRIRKVTRDGVIGTVAGNGQAGQSGDDGPATDARLNAPRGVAVDDSGNVFIADTGNSRIRLVNPAGKIETIAGVETPGLSGDGGPALRAQLNAPGGLVMDGAGNIYFADTGNGRVRRLVPEPDAAVPPPAAVMPPISVVNLASLEPGSIAPGELITIYGMGLGPESGVVGSPDAAGTIGMELGGTEVRFDGARAPVLYAQSSQVNVQVPYTIAGRDSTRIEIFYRNKPAATLDVPVAAAAPGLLAVVRNQDGSWNAENNPAGRTAEITLYGTGEGLTDGDNLAGQAAQKPCPRPKLPVRVSISGTMAEVLTAASMEGHVGILEVVVKLPGDALQAGAASATLQVGDAISPPVKVWLK